MPASLLQPFPPPSGSLLRPYWRLFKGVIRATDWWEYKFACLLGTAYAVAFYDHVAMARLWLPLLQILAAFVPCAAYVCVINDLTDQEEDKRAGKPNRMAGRSKLFRCAALGLCLLLGTTACWMLRRYPVTLALYAGNWLAFTLYSVPPFRLKTKGLWGVLADTCGGQFLPTLWVATLVAESSGHTLDLFIGLPLGCWAFALGLRGILSHQLRDHEADAHAGVGTLVMRRGPTFVSRLVAWVIFPVEIAAMLCLLIRLNTSFTWPLLALHLLAETRRGSFSSLLAAWKVPRPEQWVPPAEYYKFYYPMTFALALTRRDAAAAGLIAAHLLLFRHCSRLFALDVYRLFQWRPLVARG
jgi:4-hydroxybenzoate polyprenyltransferase